MTSPATRASFESLSISTQAFIAQLQEFILSNPSGRAVKWKDALSLVRDYYEDLRLSMRLDDSLKMMKSANALTGLNKGIADYETSVEEGVLTRQAFKVSCDAIEAAKQLRFELEKK